MEIWGQGLGTLYSIIGPVDSQGHTSTLGIEVTADGSGIDTSWYRGTQELPPVVELPKHINWSTYNPEWSGLSSRSVPHTKMWPWLTTKDHLANSLSREGFFESLALESMSIDTVRETSWAFSLAVKDKDDLYPNPIAIRDILEFIEEKGIRSQSVRFGFRGTYPLKHIKIIKRHLLDLIKGGKDSITVPWLIPDQVQSSGRIWESYNSQQMLERTKAVYGGALRIYQTIVDRWFTAFGGRFGLFACLPVRLEGRLEWPPRHSDRRHGPSLVWYPWPLPPKESSSVAFELGDTKENWENFRSDWRDGSPFMVDEIPKVFGLLPATTIATDWLTSDLRDLGWEK